MTSLVTACDPGDLQPASDDTSVDPAPDTGTPPTPDDDVTPEPPAEPAPVVRTVPAGRVADNLQLLYIFENSDTPSIIKDHSGEGDAYNVNIDNIDNVSFSAMGMSIDNPIIASNDDPVLKVLNACEASQAITIETWAQSDVLDYDQRARIIAMSVDGGNRNFGLGVNQNGGNWDARLRTSETGNNGTDPSTTAAVGPNGEMQHVVYTRVQGLTNEGTMYVDGVKTTPVQLIPGTFANWNQSYGINIGNERNGNREFIGTIALAAVYCKKLSDEEVQQNFDAGYE